MMMKRIHGVGKRSGFSLGIAVPMSMLLLFSTLAYLKWQVSSHETAIHQVAVTKAYYVAQAAVISIPLAFMRNQRPNFQVTGDIPFPNGEIAGMGRYLRPLITYTTPQGTQAGTLNPRKDYLLSATGVVNVKSFLGRSVEVRRRAQLLLRKREFSQYFYFTNEEQTRFHEFIWFFSGDSVFGPVHSNSDIGVHPGAYFGSLVTTTGVIRDVSNGTFAGLPRPGYFEHVRHIPIPYRADRLRSAAAGGGHFLTTENGRYTYGIRFDGSMGTLWRWETGARPTWGTSEAVGSVTGWNHSREYAIFCDGNLWIAGNVNGILGIGAQGNLRLMDDIVYTEAAGRNGFEVRPTDQSMMTLISEADEPSDTSRTAPWTGILIANSNPNGRNNSQSGSHIAIHGQLFALNSSFTFEDQNDDWDAYQGPTPDNRGYIYLWGAVTQNRRGYVHRGNHLSTGYLKRYHFDPRWDRSKVRTVRYPPFQMDMTSEGFLKWEIVNWQDLPRKQGDERLE